MSNFSDNEIDYIDNAMNTLQPGLVLISSEINNDSVTIDVVDSLDNTGASVTLNKDFIKEYKEEGIKDEIDDALNRERY